MSNFIKYDHHINNSSKIFLIFMHIEPSLIDVYKKIFTDLLYAEEDISDIIKLKKFYYKLDTNNHLELIVNDKPQRKLIHEFVEKTNTLISRSEYEKTNEVYTRKCSCGAWSRDYLDINLAFRCPFEHEDDETDVIGCDVTDYPCCNETIEELLEEKEIKLRYKPTGKMLIMRRDNILFGYKKQGTYRKYKSYKK